MAVTDRGKNYEKYGCKVQRKKSGCKGQRKKQWLQKKTIVTRDRENNALQGTEKNYG